MTGQFKKYLENYDLSYQEHKFHIQNNFLAKNSCVLPGNKIFEIMFFGTKFSDMDIKTQEERTYTLHESFESEIKPRFDEVLTDIGTLNNNSGNKTNIETWFETLKKVMRLYKNSQGKDKNK